VRAIWCAFWMAAAAFAADSVTTIADFDGTNPLAGWTVSRESAEGSLTAGPGHTGTGAILEYQFRRNGSVSAVWTPEKPVPFKRHGAISLWIRGSAETKVTLLVGDKSEGTRRYPFEATSLEHPSGTDWRQVVIPLAAKSTGYWDEDHSGAPKGRMTSIAILAEPRFPLTAHGTVAFDDVRLLESADLSFELAPEMPLIEAPPGAAQLGPRFGVNIHTLNDDHALQAAHNAGFGFVRADLLWAQIERNGRYRFGAYDRLLTALEARGMSALWILDYGHPQHGGGPPRNPDDVAAFARFAEAAAAHFKGHNVRYEIWNEPDTERFWPPSPNPREYAALLKEAASAIHRADPAAQVASGGLSRIDLTFLQGVVNAGGWSNLTAAAIHPYRRLAPESLAGDLPLLRVLLANGPGAQTEIWDTEWGYASYDYFSKNLKGDGHSAQGRERQAVLAAREALTVWALGLPIAVWYDLRDNGEDPKNPEHNYGLLDAEGEEKPVIHAIRALTHAAADHTNAGLVRDLPDGAHAMALKGAAGTVYVVWSDQPDSRLTVRFPAASFQWAANLTGDPIKVKSGHSEVEIPLPETAGPIFVSLVPHSTAPGNR